MAHLSALVSDEKVKKK